MIPSPDRLIDDLRAAIAETLAGDATASVRCLPINAAPLGDLFGLPEIERLLCLQGMTYPGLRLLHRSEGLQRRQYYPLLDPATRLYNPARALGQFLNAATTLKLSNLERRLPQAHALYVGLGGARGGIASLALFLSPPAGQATIAHADDHANLIVQLGGGKTWRTWARFPLADIATAGSTDELQRRFEAAARDEALETRLAPGDVLRVPSRILHEAYTTTEHSLSLSIQLLATGQDSSDRVQDYVECVL